jgi:hypothetical protein
VAAGTPFTVNDVPDAPVSNEAMSLAPGDDPASITYELGGSPPINALQVSVTVLPLTDDARLPGGPGATSASEATSRAREPRKGQSALAENISASVAARQLHVTTALLIGLTGETCAATPDGRLGEPPQLPEATGTRSYARGERDSEAVSTTNVVAGGIIDRRSRW